MCMYQGVSPAVMPIYVIGSTAQLFACSTHAKPHGTALDIAVPSMDSFSYFVLVL